jgi:hypothetical protein
MAPQRILDHNLALSRLFANLNIVRVMLNKAVTNGPLNGGRPEPGVAFRPARAPIEQIVPQFLRNGRQEAAEDAVAASS